MHDANQTDFTLEFESRFESGNLQKAVQMWVLSTDSSFQLQSSYFHPCKFFTLTDHPYFFPVQRHLRLWAHPAHRHVHQKAHAVVLLQGREHEGWSDLPLHCHQLHEEQQSVFSGHETTPLFWEGGHGERCRMATHRLQHQILSQLQSGGWFENVSTLNFAVPFPTFPAAFIVIFMDIITQILILEAGFLLKKNNISPFRTQRTTTVTQSPCTRSPGLSSSLTTQTPASWPTATPTPIHTCSATWGALPPTQQWRHTVHCGCCATAWLETPCTWWQ